MTHRHPAGSFARQHSADEHGPVLDVRALAARFVLVGIDGPRVIVRGKLDDEVGTFRFLFNPLRFLDYTPLTGHNSRQKPTG